MDFDQIVAKYSGERYQANLGLLFDLIFQFRKSFLLSFAFIFSLHCSFQFRFRIKEACYRGGNPFQIFCFPFPGLLGMSDKGRAVHIICMVFVYDYMS